MPGVVVVAIPRKDDPVWKVSSEAVPHMTLLYLGELEAINNLEGVVTYIEHVVSSSMTKFGLSVDRRAPLGPDSADVLFFREDNCTKEIGYSRQGMLANPDIRAAYNSTDQFPDWTPHLTLGYPATPAHDDKIQDYGLNWISFDTIAIWTGDSTGPEFLLPDREEASLAMSVETSPLVLAHHGVKGQKWGVRRDRSESGGSTGGGSTSGIKSAAKKKGKELSVAAKKELEARRADTVTVRTTPGEGVRTVGGNNQQAHADAIRVRTNEQIVKRSTTDAISTKDLQELVTRMNLEQQYRNLAVNEFRTTKGEDFATSLLQDVGTKAAAKFGLGDTANLAIQNVIANQTGLGNKALTGGKIKSDNKN